MLGVFFSSLCLSFPLFSMQGSGAIFLDSGCQTAEGPGLHEDTIPPGLETADSRETRTSQRHHSSWIRDCRQQMDQDFMKTRWTIGMFQDHIRG
ncbi:hypothetical protein SRHO_G00150660 [Serrasalmus rhombeus]